jgi:hypothetical protein
MGRKAGGHRRRRRFVGRWRLAGAVIVMALLASCSGDDEQAGGGDSGAEGSAGVDGVAVERVGPLDYSPVLTAVFCDGSEQVVGHLIGAAPGERIVFSSALPVDVESGVADSTGSYEFQWACQPNEAELTWELTARTDSGDTVDISFAGTSVDPGIVKELSLRIADEPFACNGQRRSIGAASGAEPLEVLVFQPARAQSILGDTVANDDGTAEISWQCDETEADQVWEVTVRGFDSGRTGTFTVTGAPAPPPVPAPSATLLEDPFLCDTYVRPVAELTGFESGEIVEFSSEDAADLLDSRADSSGKIQARWQCGPTDIGKVWTVTARGARSDRSLTLTITGGEPPEGTFNEITIDFAEDPFTCDGDSRTFATLGNFLSREFVDFESPDSGPIRQGQADTEGDLKIRWQCDAEDAGRTWLVTATGATTNKSVEFTVTAAP